MKSTRSTQRLRIIVLGYIIRGPLGGMAWHHLHFLMGLARLGHDVFFLEDSDDYPCCYDPVRDVTDMDPSYGLAFAAKVFEAIGLRDRWAYYDAHTETWHGPRRLDMTSICADADLLLNLACVNPLRPWTRRPAVRAYIDEDPGFNQIRILQNPKAKARAAEHSVFFSFGENIPAGTSQVPDDGLDWHATRQPVVLEVLDAAPGNPEAKFTTVMQWGSYRSMEHEGVHYGMKAESFEPFLTLPSIVGSVFELAVGGTAARDLLESYGWGVKDPLSVSMDPWRFQDYVRNSKGEFGIAKHGYVVGRSGWFSERSVCYLAMGRPVLAQDTGFSDWLQCDGGLLSFTGLEDAAAGIAEISAHYAHHCRLAREVAAEFFDYRKVLPELLERAMNIEVS